MIFPSNLLGLSERRTGSLDEVAFVAPGRLRTLPVVELDGTLHETRIKYDTARDGYLEDRGYRVLRFEKGEVVEYLGTVLESILKVLTTPSP